MEDRRDDLSDNEFDGCSKHTVMLSFRDDQLQSSVLLTLNTMRRSGQFCDVTFQIGKHSLSAHRVVLACCSMYLYELFSQEPTIKHQFIQLKVRDFDSFVALVDYAYTTRLEISEDKLTSVYHTARLLNMDRAADACAAFMVEHLTPANCLSTRSMANRYSDKTLTMKTDEYIRENLDEIITSSQIHKFPRLQVQIMGVTEVQPGEEQCLCQLVVNFFQKTLEQDETDNLEALAENVRVLYLQSGSHLVDCLDVEDISVTQSDLVIDYKKMNKQKWLVQGKEKMLGKKMPLSSNSIIVRHNSMLVEPEWSVIATKLHSETRCTCIALLDNNLVIITVKFHRHPSDDDNKSASVSMCSSPTGSLEKQVLPIPLSRMSSARCGVGAAVMNNKLYALGGYDRGECLNTVECYDLDTNKWLSLPPMLTPRGRFDVTQVNGRLYACGGSNGSEELRTAEFYDPETGKWSMLPEMSTCRSSAGVAVLNNKLYIIGGWSGCSGLKSCEVYDLDAGTWSNIAPLNTGRSQCAVCEYHGKLVAVGGCDAWNSTNTVEMYDPKQNKWMFIAAMTTCRRGAGVATFQDKLYVVGGSDGQQSLSSVEIYDVATNTWSLGPSLSTPRANVAVALVQEKLFAVGGFSGKAFLDSIEYLSPNEDEWSSYMCPTSPTNHDSGVHGNQNSDSDTELDFLSNGFVSAGQCEELPPLGEHIHAD